MNKATKSLLAGLALSLSIGVFAIKGSKENTVNPIIGDIANLRFEEHIANDKYLNSFKGASFSFERERVLVFLGAWLCMVSSKSSMPKDLKFSITWLTSMLRISKSLS